MDDLVRELDVGVTERNSVKQDKYVFYKFNLTDNNKLITIQYSLYSLQLELCQVMESQIQIFMCQMNVQTQQRLITNGSLLMLVL